MKIGDYLEKSKAFAGAKKREGIKSILNEKISERLGFKDFHFEKGKLMMNLLPAEKTVFGLNKKEITKDLIRASGARQVKIFNYLE